MVSLAKLQLWNCVSLGGGIKAITMFQGRGTLERDGGGVMISQAIHTLDLAMWLLGPISTVQALMIQTPLHQLEAEDWAGALFEMECGAAGIMMATTADYPGGAETITIQGTKARAHLGSGVLTITDMDGKTASFGETASTGPVQIRWPLPMNGTNQ